MTSIHFKEGRGVEPQTLAMLIRWIEWLKIRTWWGMDWWARPGALDMISWRWMGGTEEGGGDFALKWQQQREREQIPTMTARPADRNCDTIWFWLTERVNAHSWLMKRPLGERERENCDHVQSTSHNWSSCDVFGLFRCPPPPRARSGVGNQFV